MNSIIEKNKAQIISTLKKYRVKEAFVFGSVVNNNFHSKSDIDLLYSFEDGLDYETYANNYFDLIHELEQLLNRTVDLTAIKTLKNPYLINSINNSKVKLL